ncbi:sodium-dependent bicarbonate transport family permease [Stratiformator vulcanicus]|uniref:Sodium-dependent bicarbonate transport family permease n=1 Tax=Stratiformator vulcanicus TaxID=2527980 RepID=A0A517R248_9PLAN|nr:sodium-dependent bicarbonate transport family permease [Stratiformator vulcanicus]QDT37931.1 hypothetical protein Pan189_23140 [Stratiformator vulcanicus]
MELSLIAENLLAAPVLFFLLGMAATWLGSDLDVPQSIARGLSLYLLFSIGIHGGYELAESGWTAGMLSILGVAVLSAIIVPIWSFYILRQFLGPNDAGAIAATYGSISAVTFVTAVDFLRSNEVEFGGYMVAAMALMESPSIVVGVLLARLSSEDGNGRPKGELWRRLFQEAFLNGAVVILLGSLLIGLVTGDKGWPSVEPFAGAPFKGVLCLFLLEMGLGAARQVKALAKCGPFLLTFGIVAPIVHGTGAVLIARLIGASAGDATLLAVLCGSASYIAVPAAVRFALPKAKPGLYLPLSLGVTFPFNVSIGIPLYYALVTLLW